MRAFTLVEILIVISIMALLAVGSFVYFKDFSAKKAVEKAAGEVQSLLRLAQSNATSSTKCNDQGAISWSLKFTNATTMKLRCSNSSEDREVRTYTLENAQVDQINGDSECTIGLPATISYTPGLGIQSISSSDVFTLNTCLQSSIITFTIKNLINNDDNF